MQEKSYLTAFSDAILSITAIWGVLITQEKQYPVLFKTSWPNDASFTTTTLGFGCLAFASFLGFVRFAVLLPYQHELVTRMHKYFSFIGSCSGKKIYENIRKIGFPVKSLKLLVARAN